jgi:hypothetical protein
MIKLRILAVWMMLIAVGLLAGCGGGSSNNSSALPAVPASKVTGVAATGSPIAGTVYLKDSSNPAKELSTTISSDGSFSFDVSGLTAPYILKAVGTANGQNYTLYSFAGSAGIANINPLSNLAVVQANGGNDAGAVYSVPTTAKMTAIKTALTTVIPQIQALLSQILADYGVATSNFISDTYVANHSGLDLLFDLISIQVSNGSLTITNKLSSGTILVTSVGGTTLSGNVNTSVLPIIPPTSSLFGTYTLSGFEITYSNGATITSTSPSVTSFSGTFKLNSNNTASQSILLNGVPINVSATWSYNAATNRFTFFNSTGVVSAPTLSFSGNVLTTTNVTSAATEVDHWTKTSNHAARAVISTLEDEILSPAPLGGVVGSLVGAL